MAAVMTESMKAPNSEELHQALTSFISTAAGVGYARSREIGPTRFALVSGTLDQIFREQFSREDAEVIVNDFDDKSNLALAAIYEEMIYISKRYEDYGRMLNPNMVIPGPADEYSEEEGDAFSEEAVKEIDVVKSSIGFILDKLPKWAKRILEAIMEALKISRGAV